MPKVFIPRILYLGYHIYEINISDMTRYLCQFLGSFLVLFLTFRPGFS